MRLALPLSIALAAGCAAPVTPNETAGLDYGPTLDRQAAGLTPHPAGQPADELFIRENHARMSMFGQSPAQFVSVPARSGAENRNVHLGILSFRRVPGGSEEPPLRIAYTSGCRSRTVSFDV